MRSAYKKARTPPNEIPLDHRIAASGTFPMEHTNDTTAISGPTTALPISCTPWGAPLRNRAFHVSFGTNAASTPAIKKPPSRSFQSIEKSIAKFCAMATRVAGSRRRAISEPPSTAADPWSWPPVSSTRRRASSTSALGYVSLASTVMIAMSTTPPIHSAAVNCQPISNQRMIPSSMTRFVDEKRNARLGMSAAPFLNSVLLRAALAYEHDELAAPKPVASAICRITSRPSARCIRSLDTSAWTAPESAKPRMRLQPTCHAMPSASMSASPSFATNIRRTAPSWGHVHAWSRRRGRPAEALRRLPSGFDRLRQSVHVLEKHRNLPDLLVFERVHECRHRGETDAVVDLPVRCTFGVVFRAVFRELGRGHVEARGDVRSPTIRCAVAHDAVLLIRFQAGRQVGGSEGQRVPHLAHLTLGERMDRLHRQIRLDRRRSAIGGHRRIAHVHDGEHGPHDDAEQRHDANDGAAQVQHQCPPIDMPAMLPIACAMSGGRIRMKNWYPIGVPAP